ncbi:MAG: AAA family ATPase [Deltaproteobacteria bacterium]|nr:AAA family ATPase [Deltaproteobacteria bacterium]
MKVLAIELTNYRGFQHAVLELQRPLTVLIGPNGAGKSSVLDALSVVIGVAVVEALRRPWVVPALAPSDLHRSAAHAELGATLSIGGQRASVRLTADRSNGSVTMGTAVRHLAARALDEVPAAYLALAYGSRRHAAPDLRERWKGGAGPEATTPLDALVGALSDGGLGFTEFFRWFRDREDQENAEKVLRSSLSYVDPQLTAVRDAVTALLPGFTGLRVDRASLCMVLIKDGEELSVEQLSDGERNLLTLAGDIARRLAIANPAHPAPREAEAVVLVDEIELHLHPRWQREAVGALRRAFPGVQFVLTTHSPQVLSTVPSEAVVLVRDFQVYAPPAPTEGRDSNAILGEVLGVAERPEAMAARLREVVDLIDVERLAEARSRLDALAGELTERDTEVLRLRTMLDVLGRLDAPDRQGG